MRIEDIKKVLERRVEYSENGRNAAVLVPLSLCGAGELYITFIRRSSKLRLHGGDVAFPGGLREGNESPVETALREVWEELGIKREDVSVLGFLTPTRTKITDIYIVPVVGLIPLPYSFKPNHKEVAEIIHVPVLELYKNEYEDWYGKYYLYKNHRIWGASARILRNLLERLRSVFDGVP